jgi:DNA-directed RNA polymerase specialized sigma24 family protein
MGGNYSHGPTTCPGCGQGLTDGACAACGDLRPQQEKIKTIALNLRRKLRLASVPLDNLLALAERVCWDLTRRGWRQLPGCWGIFYRELSAKMQAEFAPGPEDELPKDFDRPSPERHDFEEIVAPLPETHRNLLLWLYRDGLTTLEVARRLGWTQKLVRAKRDWALARLRALEEKR